MNRRTFFKGLAGLLTLPFLPKVKAKPNWTHSVYPLEVVITDELLEDHRAMGVESNDYITDPDAWFIKDYASHKPSTLFVRRELEEMAHRSLARTEECK